jgi:hypothetical protein
MNRYIATHFLTEHLLTLFLYVQYGRHPGDILILATVSSRKWHLPELQHQQPCHSSMHKLSFTNPQTEKPMGVKSCDLGGHTV